MNMAFKHDPLIKGHPILRKNTKSYDSSSKNLLVCGLAPKQVAHRVLPQIT